MVVTADVVVGSIAFVVGSTVVVTDSTESDVVISIAVVIGSTFVVGTYSTVKHEYSVAFAGGVSPPLINASHMHYITVLLYSGTDGMVSVLRPPLLIRVTLENCVDNDPFTN